MTERSASVERALAMAGRALVRVLLLVLLVVVGRALVMLPAEGGLGAAVGDALPRSGVEHDVTAVLLNFRGWDTLLEVTVLLVALLGMRVIAAPKGTSRDPGPVVRALAMLVIPFLILFAGYLLWAGAYEPGGAFQAGTLLAAAGLLAALAGYPWLADMPDAPLRAIVVLGPAVFAAIAAGVMPAGYRVLEYPPGLAGPLILVIETTVMISIGVTLLAAFHGARGTATGEGG